MSDKQFERKHKEDKPVVAICYDFDKTLTPDDMQAQGFIQEIGMDVGEFWKESNALADKNNMDQNLAYMFYMKEKAYGQFLFNKKRLPITGQKLPCSPAWRIGSSGYANMEKSGVRSSNIILYRRDWRR